MLIFFENRNFILPSGDIKWKKSNIFIVFIYILSFSFCVRFGLFVVVVVKCHQFLLLSTTKKNYTKVDICRILFLCKKINFQRVLISIITIYSSWACFFICLYILAYGNKRAIKTTHIDQLGYLYLLNFE